MLVVEAVPLAIAEGLDAGVVVTAGCTPRVDHDREELKGQRTLEKGPWGKKVKNTYTPNGKPHTSICIVCVNTL